MSKYKTFVGHAFDAETACQHANNRCDRWIAVNEVHEIDREVGTAVKEDDNLWMCQVTLEYDEGNDTEDDAADVSDDGSEGKNKQ